MLGSLVEFRIADPARSDLQDLADCVDEPLITQSAGMSPAHVRTRRSMAAVKSIPLKIAANPPNFTGPEQSVLRPESASQQTGIPF